MKYANGTYQDGMWSNAKFVGWSDYLLNILHMEEDLFDWIFSDWDDINFFI
jgi:hypothetical protein